MSYKSQDEITTNIAKACVEARKVAKQARKDIRDIANNANVSEGFIYKLINGRK